MSIRNMVKHHAILKNVCCLLIGFLLIGVSTVFAQEEAPERNWSLGLGAGAKFQAVYSGSNELAPVPFPFITAEYRTTYVDVFAMGDEAGFRVKSPGLQGSDLSFGVKMGSGRDNENELVENLLEGTPTIENLVQAFGKLKWLSPVGQLTSTVYWLPITAEYDQAGIADEEYSGLKAVFDYAIGGNVDDRLFAFATLGTTWMNDEYAEAYYSVLHPAPKLDLFEAEAGMNDVHGSLGAMYSLSKHMESILLLEWAQLLGDAADSSLTKEEFQPTMTLIVYYDF